MRWSLSPWRETRRERPPSPVQTLRSVCGGTQQAGYSFQRNGHPLRPTAQLIVNLVERLTGLEAGEQEPDRAPVRREQARPSHGDEVLAQEGVARQPRPGTDVRCQAAGADVSRVHLLAKGDGSGVVKGAEHAGEILERSGLAASDRDG